MKPIQRLILACLVYSLGVETSFAHAPIEGIGTFYNGVLHPVLVPSHLLLLIATGCLLGQFAPVSSRQGLPAFLAALCIAVASTMYAVIKIPVWMLPAFSVLVGVTIAAKRPIADIAYVIIALVAGTLVGLTSAPDSKLATAPGLAVMGTVLGGAAIVTIAGGVAAVATSAWQKTVIRVLGSWIAASSMMILAFEWTKIAQD